MKCYRTLICALSVCLLSSVLAQEAPNATAGRNDAVANALPQPVGRMASGVTLRADGTLVGQVDYIDESTLELRPVANAIVTFMQNRAVIAQARTLPTGSFEVKGLSPSAIYSVFVTHRDWFAATAALTLPSPVARGGENASAGKQPVNVFVATQARSAAKLSATTRVRLVNQNSNVLEIQMVPREDFVAALQSGVLGNDVGGGGPGGLPGGGVGGGAAGGGGGGSGGGGGGGGGGIGAIGALGAAAGIIAGSRSSSRARIASPAGP